MRAKRILSLLLVMLMMLPTTAVFAAVDTLNAVTVNNSTRQIVISGTSIQRNGTPVAVSVWYPQASPLNVGGSVPLNQLNAYTDQTAVLNGNYQISFYLQADAPSGQYTVYVYIPGMTTPLSTTFPYCDIVKRDALINVVKDPSKGADDIKLALDNNISAVNVNAGISYANYNNTQKNYVANYVAANRPTEPSNDAAAASLSTTLDTVITALDTVKTLTTSSRERIKNILDAESTDMKMQINSTLTTNMSAALTAYAALTDIQKPAAIVAFEAGAGDLVLPENVITLLLQAINTATTPVIIPNPSLPGGELNDKKKDDSSYVKDLGNQANAGTSAEQIEGIANSFSDLGNAPWAKTAITVLADRKIVSGKANGLFYPNDNITREEFVKLLIGGLELYTLQEKALPFDDVTLGKWYYEPILMAYTLGLIEGTDEDTFGVGTPITRQDMAVLLQRVFTMQKITFAEEETTTYSDESQIAEYARYSVNTISASGIMNGRDDGTFDPQATASRAEAATIIYRVMYKLNLF